MVQGGQVNLKSLRRGLQVSVPASYIIDIEMVPQGDYSSQDLSIRWKVKKFTKKYMDINLGFDKPLFVSASSQHDLLKVTIKSSAIFLDEDYLTFEQDQILLKPVPKQYSDL